MTATGALEGRGLARRFGGVTAVSGVDVRIVPGRVTLVLGPNGAGKSTLVNCLTGVDQPSEGNVFLDGKDLTGKTSNRFAQLGVARTFQHARPFRGLTLAENVMVGAHGRTRAGFVRGTLRTPFARREEAELRQTASLLLAEVGLEGREAGSPNDLTLEEERRLELARCLAGNPHILLLDEPAAGLGEDEATALATLVRNLCVDHGLGVLLIEHHLELALSLSDSVLVLDFGKPIFEGTPTEARLDPAVRTAYIGAEGDQ
ncbi:MAG TPA: ABC transporter ATP-binding protein [Nocardioidaceae bacterium]|nr:ABC transporter ATP-binding protein [Nocardioidaceae bacterium]